MSKTKKILIGIILMSVLLLGLGYAAIQNVTLNITGTATADPSQSNFSVKFTGTPEVSDSSKVTAAITDDTNATINVEGLTASGETVTATYTIQNASTDLSADLTVETTNSNEEYFVLDAELAKTSIVAGEATTLTVTVELIKTPISEVETSTIGIQLTAVPVQPGQEGTSGGIGGTTSSATLNEYGFYYGVPYSMLEDGEKISFVFLEKGAANLYENEIKMQQVPEGYFTYEEKKILIGNEGLTVSNDGTQLILDENFILVAEFGVKIGIPCGIWGHAENDGEEHIIVEECASGHYVCEQKCGIWEVPTGGTYTMVTPVDGNKTVYNENEALPKCYVSKEGDSFIYGDYEYRYSQYFEISKKQWDSSVGNGWGVRVIDDTKTEYGEICSKINGGNLKFLGGTFANCVNMTKSPLLPEGITLMWSAFSGCTSLTTAPLIPNSVGSMIATYSGCNNLKTYVGSTDKDGDFSAYIIPDNVYEMPSLFYGCTLMTVSPKLPSRAKYISGMFCECIALTSAPEIPEGVVDMDAAFGGCSSLKTYVGSVAEDGDFSNYIIPDSVTGMQNTFNGCTLLEVTPRIPEGVKYLTGTFQDCISLVTVTNIPNTVTHLNATFAGCDKMVIAPEIPESVTNMNDTFLHCDSLTTAPVIPYNVENLLGTFNDCKNLTGTIQINTDKINNVINDLNQVGTGYRCFQNTSKSIVLKGTGTNTTTLQILEETANNGNVTVEQ